MECVELGEERETALIKHDEIQHNNIFTKKERQCHMHDEKANEQL